jgi:trk system potassium uptake protein TrkH
MWRSFTHWVGGMGVLVFIMAFVPLSGGRNMHIMKAESTGPDVGKLVPRVRATALLLYAIYLGFTVLQFILLLFGRMSVFEALNTAFSTAGTGGFGFKNDSMLSYSPYVQVVVTVFMLLFSINFGAYYLAFRGKLREALNSEVRTFLLIVLGAVVLIVFSITANIATDPALQAQFGSAENLGDIIRHVTFTVAALISTTGFGTVDFALWPALACTILVMVMFVGACAGSTGGGMKVSRFMLLFKGILRDLRAAIHPKQVKQITMDKKPVGQAVVQATFSYFACFMVVVAASVMLLAIDGYDFTTNFTAVAATINNIGPGLSGVGPTCNYAFFSPLSKFVMMFDMLVGRLELFPMLILFMPSTWKK